MAHWVIFNVSPANEGLVEPSEANAMLAPDAVQPEKAKVRLGLRHRTCNDALDPTLRTSAAQSFEAALRERIIGQDEALDAVVEFLRFSFLASIPRTPR